MPDKYELINAYVCMCGPSARNGGNTSSPSALTGVTCRCKSGCMHYTNSICSIPYDEQNKPERCDVKHDLQSCMGMDILCHTPCKIL